MRSNLTDRSNSHSLSGPVTYINGQPDPTYKALTDAQRNKVIGAVGNEVYTSQAMRDAAIRRAAEYAEQTHKMVTALTDKHFGLDVKLSLTESNALEVLLTSLQRNRSYASLIETVSNYKASKTVGNYKSLLSVLEAAVLEEL
jgi:uncharacterized protein involved in outer membrane biogenesis